MTLKEYNDYISQVGTEYFYDNILTYIEKEIFPNNYLLSWKLYGVNKPINENVYLTIRANERGIYTKVNVYQNDCWGPCEDDDNTITIYYKELIF
jgi:hypothetical protein